MTDAVAASLVLALLSGIGVFSLGFTAAGVQAVAGIAVVLDAVWILLASSYLWRRPELATPDVRPSVRRGL